jgi:glycolate oxidase iron-sulfur subunit
MSRAQVKPAWPGANLELVAPPGSVEQPLVMPVAYELLLDCVHCGLCLEACPTYTELGNEADSPRGRIHLMRALADQRVPVSDRVVRHLDLCLGCRACETACPSGVRYGSLIEAARSMVEVSHRRAPQAALLRRFLIGSVLPYPRRLRLALAPLRLVDRLGLRRLVSRFLPTALRRLVELVPPARRAPGIPAVTSAASGAGKPLGSVGLLRGCVMPLFYPDITAATARVLAAAGYRVEAPESGCCGALALHSGDHQSALRAARRTVDAFSPRDSGGGSGEGVQALVTNAAGCGATMRDYGELLRDEPAYAARAAALAARVRDVSELLDGAAGERLRLGPVPGAVTYHDACHLAHGQGVRAAPRQLLARIPGLELTALAESDVCCGSAGTYNLTEPAMADRLLSRKIDRILATGASSVVTGNPGCMVQIAAGLRSRGSAIEVLHTVELIDRALRAAGDGRPGSSAPSPGVADD